MRGGHGLRPLEHVRVHLGSVAPVPPLLLFSPSLAATLQSLADCCRPQPARSVHVSHDHTDVWDDDFLADSALERALPAGVTPAGPKADYIGAANFAPALTTLGSRHAPGLTAEADLGYAVAPRARDTHRRPSHQPSLQPRPLAPVPLCPGASMHERTH